MRRAVVKRGATDVSLGQLLRVGGEVPEAHETMGLAAAHALIEPVQGGGSDVQLSLGPQPHCDLRHQGYEIVAGERDLAVVAGFAYGGFSPAAP